MNTQTEAERLADRLKAWPDAEELDDAAAELIRLQEEVNEQCRINGMGTEREAKLMAELEQERRANAELLEALRLIRDVSGGAAVAIAEATIAKHSKENT